MMELNKLNQSISEYEYMEENTCYKKYIDPRWKVQRDSSPCFKMVKPLILYRTTIENIVAE
jgi:hypothetical protein